MIKVGKYEIDDSKQKGRVTYKTTCPACAESGKTHLKDTPLSVNSVEKIFKCHKCGWKGTYKEMDKRTYTSNEKIVEYSKPVIQNITELSEEHVNYFFKRGITQKTLKRNNVATGKDKNNNFNDWINFTYFDDGEVVNVKSRKSTEKKFMQVAGAKQVMYKLKDIVNQKNIIICEGEMDSLSWEEAGFEFATSVSQGAPNVNDENTDKKLACIFNCFDVFEQAEKIYINVDNDNNGFRLQKELIRIFGEEKVLIIDLSIYSKHSGEVCKDANDVLCLENGKEKLKEAFENAKEIRKEGVFSANDFKQEILSDYFNGQPKGSTTHIKDIDPIYTHRKGEVNLWTGYNNDGKSQLLRYLLLLKSKYDGWKHGFFCPEDMPFQEFYTDIIETYQGKTADLFYERAENHMTEEQLLNGLAFADKHFFTVYPEKEKSLDELLNRFSYMIRKYNLDTVTFDPYNQIEHLIENGKREDLYISTFMSKLKAFAVKHNICLHLVAHQVTPKAMQNGKFPKPSRYAIKGGGTFSDKADNVLLIWRENRFEKGDTGVTLISEKIKKQKLTGKPGEYSFNYDFFKNRYIFGGHDPLEIPTEISENENVWKSIPINSSFEDITYNETEIGFDYNSKGDFPF